MWMQGDLYRARTKDDRRRERHHSVSKILTAVDDMRIQDAIELEKCDYRSDENDEYVRATIKLFGYMEERMEEGGGGHLAVYNGSECLDENMINFNICLILDLLNIFILILPAFSIVLIFFLKFKFACKFQIL